MFPVAAVCMTLLVAFWLWTMFQVATSPRAEGIEKALWVLINFMFPILGYFAFVLAKPEPKRTLRDIANERR